MQLRLLLDTNVWLDYFIDRSAMHDQARDVVLRCIDKDIDLLAALLSVKDCFFLVSQELKRAERSEVGTVSESAAAAIREVAWSCASSIRKLAYIVPLDESDMLEAILLRAAHPDFEDNLVLAAAMRAQADHIVTSDKSLIAHAPMSCLSLDDALKLVE